MRITVYYSITKKINMKIPDEFEELEKRFSFSEGGYKKPQELAGELEEIILDRLPPDAEILGILNADTQETLYE